MAATRSEELIARRSRKIDARRGAFALLAMLGMLCVACAQLEPPPRSDARHVVRPGDTLGSIAAGYGIGADRLARANRLQSTDRVEPGRRLRIPDGARIVHRVRRGETLQQISSRYRVRVSTIAHLNRLGRFPRLEPGERLILPREARLPAPASAGSARSPQTAARPAERPAARVTAPEATARPREEPPAVAAAPPPAIDPEVERARKLVVQSVDDYRSARFERALERSSEAEAMLARSAHREAHSLRAHAVFVTGSSLAALGETDRAKAAFARVHALDPKFEPPKGWLSPRLEALYLAARQD